MTDAPRLPTPSELEQIARMDSGSGAAEDVLAGSREMLECASVAVFDNYMPDSPGYCGRVAVVVWPGGYELTEVYALDDWEGV